MRLIRDGWIVEGDRERFYFPDDREDDARRCLAYLRWQISYTSDHRDEPVMKPLYTFEAEVV